MSTFSRRASRGRVSAATAAAASFSRRCGTRCSPPRGEFRWFAIPTDDYGRACAGGAEQAKEFVLFLRDNEDEREGGHPFQEVMAAQAQAEAAGASVGYRVGFWAELATYLAQLASGAGFDAFAEASIDAAHRDSNFYAEQHASMGAPR